MPVHYSEHSSGPSTRQARADEEDVAYSDLTRDDLQALTKADLQSLAETRGLSKSGSKSDLIARLESA